MVGGFGVLLNGMSPSDTSSQGGISMKKEAERGAPARGDG